MLAARFGPEKLADIFEQLDEDEMVEVSEHLDTERLADVLDAMEPDMAAAPSILITPARPAPIVAVILAGNP